MKEKDMSEKRWERASLSEHEFWEKWKESANLKDIRRDLIKRAHGVNTLIKKYAEIKPQKILQIGPAANGEIHFMKGERSAIDPLASYFKATFPELIDKKVAFIDGMGENCPYPDSSFDVILILNVLDHCDVPSKVVQEMQRCLCKGGLLIFQLNMYSKTAAFIHQKFNFLDPEHPHAITHHDIKQLFNKNFSVLQENFSHHPVKTKHPIKSFVLLFANLLKLYPVDYRAVYRKF